MPRTRRRFLPALAAAAAATPAAAQTQVVLKGDTTPGGGTYSGFYSAALNDAGQVAFRADVSSKTTTGGVFYTTAGGVQAAALEGAAAPGGGGTFGGIFNSIGVNAGGEVAFTSVNASGVYATSAGGLQAIARTNSPTPSGGNYSTFTVSDGLAFNSAGRVAIFNELVVGGPAASGVFTGGPGTMQTVALDGGTTPAGGTYRSLTAPTLNASGQVAFRSGGALLTSNAIFLGTPGPGGVTVTTVAANGGATPIGGTFGMFQPQSPGLNDAGQVAFFSTVSGGSALSGVFVGTAGSLKAVAVAGGAAPNGQQYSSFNALALNAVGQVAFTAELKAPSIVTGLFVGTPTSVAAAAIEGTAAPGGGTYVNILSAPTLNAAGQVAFTASVSGVSASNIKALFAGRPGEVVRVVAQGDVIDIDPGPGQTLRTVSGVGGVGGFADGSGGEDGLPTGLASDGTLAYVLTFTDGSSGVFTSVIPVPVPEPACLLAAASAGWLLARRGRRRSRAGRGM
jgi:hypothetical protein